MDNLGFKIVREEAKVACQRFDGAAPYVVLHFTSWEQSLAVYRRGVACRKKGTNFILHTEHYIASFPCRCLVEKSIE